MFYNEELNYERKLQMPMHATLLNAKTLTFLTKINGGVAPSNSFSQNTHVFVYGDRLDDIEENRLMTIEEFEKVYKYHQCEDTNCNIVVRK